MRPRRKVEADQPVAFLGQAAHTNKHQREALEGQLSPIHSLLPTRMLLLLRAEYLRREILTFYFRTLDVGRLIAII